MTIWWLNNISRANKERTDLAELAERSDWLVDLSITLGDGNLCAVFVIAHGDESFPLTMTYPVVFPDAPPLVKTQDGKRISGHQYGTSGELCLEYRPDNWRAEITGAMMVASAHTLLCGEHPQEGSEVPEIIDGHSVSIGQITRSSWVRYILTTEDFQAISDLQENFLFEGKINKRSKESNFVARLNSICLENGSEWQTSSNLSPTSWEETCYIINEPKSDMPKSPSAEELLSILTTVQGGKIPTKVVDNLESFYLLVGKDKSWNLYWLHHSDDEYKVITFRTIFDEGPKRRLEEKLGLLQEKKVGVVGCGSVGSKVAIQLARTGVGSFLLLDEDIFFEGNIVRNELVTCDVGFHKSLAVRSRVLSVNPNANTEIKQIRLGGQESSASTVSAMEQLATCDLIVDATADPTAFTIIASVCKRNKIPAIWGSVFAGGFGGLIGRALPDSDPPPLESRQQIIRWCENQGIDFPYREDGDGAYEAHGVDGQPEIATDSEVTIIASHITRFAIDTLVRPNDSEFPNSAYAIGFSRSWIFGAPFDTRPIEYTESGNWSSSGEAATPEEFAKFITDLIPPEEASDA